MSNQALNQLKKEIGGWGNQTILFAMNIRAEETGKLKDDSNYMKAMVDESRKVAVELWNKTLSECSKPVKPGEFTGLFARNVLDWCANHRKT